MFMKLLIYLLTSVYGVTIVMETEHIRKGVFEIYGAPDSVKWLHIHFVMIICLLCH